MNNVQLSAAARSRCLTNRERTPHMSMHRLARYMTLSKGERRLAVLAEKNPPLFGHGEAAAQRLFAEALRRQWSGAELFSIARGRWLDGWIETRFVRRQRDAALEVTSCFSSHLDSINAVLSRRHLAIRSCPTTNWRPLVRKSVSVSDRPALVLARRRRGVREVGLLSFHISRRRPHTARDVQMAAVLLYELAGANRDRLHDVIEPSLCIAIDAISGDMSTAALGRKRRLGMVDSSCDEIAALWPVL